jgi:hypothetical protein
MRAAVVFSLAGLLAPLCPAGQLTFEDRIELTRGLTAEYAKVKLLLPRSRKPLEFNVSGDWDKKQWEAAAREGGPAARSGDLVQITKIDIGDDKIIFEINGGLKGKTKWYEHIQIGMGNTTAPVSQQGNSNAPNGTSIVLLFHKPLEPIKAAEVKKILSPILDFEKRTATELYVDTLPPEVKQAIADKRVTEGMTHDQVVLALGRPAHKSRETDKEGLEVEDWVFGTPPGKITFVTFNGDKVIKVKESYAGLGSEVADPPVPR